MSADTLLSTIVLVSFLVTVVLAIGSLLAYRVRERRRPRRAEAAAGAGRVFFERVPYEEPAAVRKGRA